VTIAFIISDTVVNGLVRRILDEVSKHRTLSKI